MPPSNELKLNRDNIAKIVTDARGVEGFDEDEKNPVSEFDSDEREYESRETASSPEEGAAQEPAITPAPQPNAPAPEPRYDLNQELLGINRDLIGMLNQRHAPAPQPVQPQEVRDPNTLAMYSDVQALENRFGEIGHVMNLAYRGLERQVEGDAESAWQNFAKEFPDAAEMADPQHGNMRTMFERALVTVKRESVNAARQGKEFPINWATELRNHYNMLDAPRLRAADKARKEQEAQKAQHKAELDKIQGVPAHAGKFQNTAAKTSRESKEASSRAGRDPVKTTLDGFRSRVSSLVNKMRSGDD